MTVSTDELAYVQSIVRNDSAIVLDDSKAYLVEARLQPVAREQGLATIGALVDELKRGSTTLRARVVEALTTNETSFFRDVHPFDALATTVVPALLPARAANRRLRIWSAACSSGQESYSIAMTMVDRAPQLAHWDVRIHGTDLSREMVARATAGQYTQLEVNRGLAAPLLLRHFERAGTAWTVKPSLRALTSFTQMNLTRPWPLREQFDIVFLRNVLIYFDTETKADILARMRGVLAPDGYLFLGAAEMLLAKTAGYTIERDERCTWCRPA